MPRPAIEPHLQTLLSRERTFIGSLFQINEKGTGLFFCSLYAPGDGPSVVLADGIVYGYAEGESPEDAIHAARDRMWKGL